MHERLIAVARPLLSLPLGDGRSDLWLWEHSERVARLALAIAALPDYADEELDQDALFAAGLFHDAGWAEQSRQARIERSGVLARPTSDIQRELGAALLLERVTGVLSPKAARAAADAIRACNSRFAEQPEARILADAENLDEFGVLYLLRQFRAQQFDSRPMEHLLTNWHRQREYHYWDARLKDGFHSDAVRELARQRLANVESLILAISREVAAADVEPEPAPR